MGLKSKHETHEGPAAERGGKSKRREGGFSDGEMGRGPTPYKKSQSASPGTLAQHHGTAGRGGSGVYGKSGNMGHAEDLCHPESHAEFEDLGRG